MTQTPSPKPEKQLICNPMQLLMEIAPQRIRIVQGGRGIGKSTTAGTEIKNTVYDMPLAKSFILSVTYQYALTRTLPSTIKALRTLGFIQGLHFFVGRFPPAKWGWPQCYEPPGDPSHSIFFYNGSVYDLLSEDTGSRGGNYASGIIDEMQETDQHYFENDVLPTLRLEYQLLKNHRTYRRISGFCSMPRTRRAEWIFEFEKLAIQFPKEYLWLSGPSSLNSANLPPDWFRDMKRKMSPEDYAIEIENKRPTRIAGGFYPQFDDRNCTYSAFNNDYLDGIISNANGYRSEDFDNLSCLQDDDIILSEPLDIAMDFGSWFNGILTGQESNNTFRFLSAMSIDEKKTFEDLLNQWCQYYRFHQDKTVYFWYDHTAKDTDSRTEQYPIIVNRVLRSFGWTVVEMYIGHQPSPEDRYKFWGYAHRNDHPDLPRFLYNRHHCKYLIISVNGANIKQTPDGFKKDKKDEGNHAIDQRTATHFSDIMDTLAVGKYGNRLSGGIKVIRTRFGGK
jgi:hypothetical protein